MANLIDRQAALGIIQSLYPGMPRVPWLRKDWQKRYEPYINAEKAIRSLPYAQPERKRGKWIYREAYKGARFGFLECSCCGEVVWLRKDEPDKFCRNCGAQMEANDGEITKRID